MSIKKLEKKLTKLEKKYDKATPVEKVRIMKSAKSVQKRLDFLKGD